MNTEPLPNLEIRQIGKPAKETQKERLSKSRGTGEYACLETA